jgi:mono/diheme cytochrome c family protein
MTCVIGEMKTNDSKKDPTVRSSFFHLRTSIILLTGLAALATGCRKEDMSDQPKFYKPYKETAMFEDGTSARPLPEHTIARGHLQLEKDLFTGMRYGPDGKLNEPIDYFPIALNKDDIERGGEKFDIYCAVCHGKLGDGAGMIVTRGMIRPPSFVRLDNPPTDPAAYARYVNVQRAPVGHYFDVITNGYGAMYSYNDRIGVEDRWRIVAYIKALQVSQDADMKQVTFKPAPFNGAPVPVQTSVDVPVVK